MKKFDFEFLLIIIVVIITSVLAVNRSNSSNLSSSSNRLNIEKVSGQTPQARGHEPWYVDGYGSDIGAYGKSDYYWLIPLVIVIGFGALLIPLLGTLMTTLITQGTINLTAGRKKRSIENERLEMSAKGNSIPDYIIGLLTKVEEALEKFGNEIKSDDLPFKSTNEANGFVDHN